MAETPKNEVKRRQNPYLKVRQWSLTAWLALLLVLQVALSPDITQVWVFGTGIGIWYACLFLLERRATRRHNAPYQGIEVIDSRIGSADYFHLVRSKTLLPSPRKYESESKYEYDVQLAGADQVEDVVFAAMRVRLPGPWDEVFAFHPAKIYIDRYPVTLPKSKKCSFAPAGFAGEKPIFQLV